MKMKVNEVINSSTSSISVVAPQDLANTAVHWHSATSVQTLTHIKYVYNVLMRINYNYASTHTLHYVHVCICAPTRPPTHSPTHPLTHPPTHPPTHPLTYPPTHPPTHSPTHSPTHLPTHSPTHLPTHSPTHLPTHPSPTHSLTHSPTHSPTHLPTHLPTHTGLSTPHAFTHQHNPNSPSPGNAAFIFFPSSCICA